MNKTEKTLGAVVMLGGSLVGLVALNDYLEGDDNDKNFAITANLPTRPEATPIPNEIKWGYEDYKYKGTQYRHQIKVLMETNPEEGKRLQEKYNELLKVTEGNEYLDGGEEFKPKQGDIFMIDDPSSREAGVVLRDGPTVERNAGFNNAVYNGATVSINGDGIEAKGYDFQTGLAIKETMYPITVLTDSPYYQNSDEAFYPETGFIPKKYLGEKLKPVNQGN